MSYFAGGGWRNPTSTLAQATTTTNTVSASRQGSIDESIASSTPERKPFMRSQTDPYARGLQRNPSQTSILSNTPNPDAGAGAAAGAAAGRRFTFRGVARALPYFLRPAAAAVSVVTEEVERIAVSASPPSQSVLDSQIRAPVKRSTLPEEESASAEEEVKKDSTLAPSEGEVKEDSPSGPPEEEVKKDSTSALPEEEAKKDLITASPEEHSESVEDGERQESRGRRSTGSSDTSTIITEEPQPLSQGTEDELSEAKRRLNDFAEQYSTTQKRVRELESENKEKEALLKLAEEATLKEKAELVRVHAAELEEQRREILQLQQSLQVNQRQSKEQGEKLDKLVREKDDLRKEMAKRDGLLQSANSELKDLRIVKEELSGSVQKLQSTIEERDAILKDLRGWNTTLEQTIQLLKKEKAEVQAEIVQRNVSNQAAFNQLTKTHQEKMNDAARRIQRLQEELSNSNTTTSQLRVSLEASSAKVNEVSHVVEEHAGEILRLQQQLAGAQKNNQELQSKVANQISQMQSIKATSEKERADLCATHAAEVSTQQSLVQNLQKTLESLQHDLQVRDDQIATFIHEKQDLQAQVKELEGQCRAREAQSEGLKGDLAKANATIQDLGKENRTLQSKTQKEKAALVKQAEQLRKDLDDAQKVSVERSGQIEQLEATKNDLANALRRVQATMAEKESTILGLQRKCSTLDKAKKGLDERVAELGRVSIEEKEVAERILKETVEGHQREMTQARGRIQDLQDELSSFITTAQQLHVSLEASHADTEKAEKIAKEREVELSQLQQRTTSLQGTIRTLESKITEVTSQLKALEKATREEKSVILRSHTSEIEAQKKEAKIRQETLERNLRDKEERLQASIGEAETLRQEVAMMKERSLKNEQDIKSVNTTLRDVAERSKLTIERLENEKLKLDDEKAKVDGELGQLQHRVEELQKVLQERSEEIEKFKENPFHKMGSAMSNALDGIRYLLGVSSPAAANRSV